MTDFPLLAGRSTFCPTSGGTGISSSTRPGRIAELYGYRRIETPTLGEVSLYVRATGEATDIVQKEMYAFRDQGGDDLTLRPEGTAPVVRAYFQHGMNRLAAACKALLHRAHVPA